MRYTVRTSIVMVVGRLWMPMVEGATRLTLTGYDVDNARDDEGNLTRESVQRWLDCHAGDFSEIIDFSASLEDDRNDTTVDIEWSDEDNEMTYYACMSPEED